MAARKTSLSCFTRLRKRSWKRTTQGNPNLRSRMSSTTSIRSITGPGWPKGWTTMWPFELMLKYPAPQPGMLYSCSDRSMDQSEFDIDAGDLPHRGARSQDLVRVIEPALADALVRRARAAVARLGTQRFRW